MNVLITGANGFIAKNFIATLENIRDGKDKTFNITSDINLYKCTRDTDLETLMRYCKEADCVFHLAGVNRPENQDEFIKGNGGFTEHLIDMLHKNNNNCPIVFTSSIQAEKDNLYGLSKKYAEEKLKSYAKNNKSNVYIYRLPNVFGKWCKPNYNSVVATFCYNIANGLPIQINDKNAKLKLVYIDDVVRSFVSILEKKDDIVEVEYCEINDIFETTVGEIANLIYRFKNDRQKCYLPSTAEGTFSKYLYSTYLSYLPCDDFVYTPKMNIDERGSFTELFKTVEFGQVSVNISKPGITKGEHWHNTKNEKFVVVSGKGLIQFRKYNESEIIEYYVSGEQIQIIDIPPGYTHNIINMGTTDMVTVMWCNECFDKNKPDTYYLKVEE